MIQVVIWGAGDRGERIIYHIGEENVRAVIDQSEKKRGTLFHGKKVICFEQYLEECSDCPIVISTHEQEIAWTLEQKGIFHYLRMDYQ